MNGIGLWFIVGFSIRFSGTLGYWAWFASFRLGLQTALLFWGSGFGAVFFVWFGLP